MTMTRTRNLIRRKIKAGALQLVVAIALVLFLLIGLFLLRKGLTGHLMAGVQTEEQLRLNIQSAVALLEQKDGMNAPDSITINLFPELGDSTTVTLKPWGLFDLGMITSKIRKQQKRGVYLFGGDLGPRDKLPSLYFSDPDRYLSVAGFTYLGNNTYLPGFGIRGAYVNGIGYYREQLVHGTSDRASDSLPQLTSKLRSRYVAYLSSDINDIGTGVDFFDGDLYARTIKRSFYERSLLIDREDDLDLRGVSLVGNIILRSVGTVIIDSTTQIDQCIVIGRTIEIGNGFSGRGQFFASERIEVGTESQFFMPSVMAVICPDNSGTIELMDRVTFTGNIVFQNANREFQPGLKIGEGCRIVGQVYCHGYCDFHATLFGSLYTCGFVSVTDNSFNQNFLLNTCIDAERLPAEFGGVNMIDGKSRFRQIETLF